ncbi:hypothetical protein STCU_09949 [Strigomonas culicis]|uniref:Uncharacterized protein n=1 Tax=Strigomonas culicis TaxID=28005 RepID=S9TPT0_9TRYP|nr:hypothetical protein STCU_09949 [Strigomonas culicis]|eukprot:EPY18478.1 hypothetical protein STCU_09949 [Strigomonas culicis]
MGANAVQPVNIGSGEDNSCGCSLNVHSQPPPPTASHPPSHHADVHPSTTIYAKVANKKCTAPLPSPQSTDTQRRLSQPTPANPLENAPKCDSPLHAFEGHPPKAERPRTLLIEALEQEQQESGTQPVWAQEQQLAYLMYYAAADGLRPPRAHDVRVVQHLPPRTERRGSRAAPPGGADRRRGKSRVQFIMADLHDNE